LRQQLTEVQSSQQRSDEHPVRVLCQDETRCGLLPLQRRRITLSGIKPVGLVQYYFENFYIYGAVEPTTGESFFLELPQLNTINFQIFLNELAHHYQETLNIVLMDNGSCHKARALVIPDNIICVFLPPYSPELNPIERLWQDLKERLAWVLVAQIDELAQQVGAMLVQYAKTMIQSLTSYPYFVQAVHALSS
jgi:transposase